MAREQKPPLGWHIYEFADRFELSEDSRLCRKGPLLFCREAVSPTDDGAKDYCLQLEALHRYDNHLELHGAFIALRNQAADRSRAYRGYLLNGKRRPATIADIADWLRVPTARCRAILKRLEAVGLIERVPLPAFDLSLNEKPSKSEIPGNSGEERRPYSNDKKERKGKGNSKATANGNGKARGKKTNGRVKPAEPKAEAQGQDHQAGQAKGEGVVQEQTTRTPTTTPPKPSMPTVVDQGGPVGPSGPNPPPASLTAPGRPATPQGHCRADPSAMSDALAEIERHLRGQPPPADGGRYSDRAETFAGEIYLALGLNYGRLQAARERGCFAARWTEAETAGLAPSAADRLWNHALEKAKELAKKKRVKKPGSMFCTLWPIMLSQARER